MRKAFAVSSLVVLAGATTTVAIAQDPVPPVAGAKGSTTYAGGSVGPGKGVGRKGDAFVALNTDGSGRRGRLTVGYVGCVGGELRGARVAIAADGTFRIRKTSRRNERTARRRVTFDISGTLSRTAGQIEMTADAKYDPKKKGKTTTCTQRVSMQVRVTKPRPRSAPAAAPVPNGVYLGRTSQRHEGRSYPFILQMDASGTKVLRTLFIYRINCNRGPGYELSDFSPGATVRNSRFTKTSKFTVRQKGGYRDAYTIAVRAKFTTDGLRGTVKVTNRYSRKGRTLVRCNTPKLQLHLVT